jgi:hypothetical protein
MSNTSIISFVLLTIATGYFFVYSPMGDLNTLMSQKQEYQKDLDTVSSIESVKSDLLAKFNKISDDDKKNINIMLPDSQNFIKLVSQIDSVAAAYGISIGNISSKKADTSVGDSISEAAPAKPYNSAIISFTFIAPYDKFNAFMGELGKSLRVLDVRSVKLKSAAKDKNGRDAGYVYDVQFETYWTNKT